ncbi:MAG: tetratricopeptide repeat protein [Acidobacteria bacterium]|nr:tetratricopeptide repeat protein [Acidobacteriota bacterium]
MTQKFCPNCRAVTVEKARYCRDCGAPLLSATGKNPGGAIVSPLAATIPLSEHDYPAGRSDADGHGAQEQYAPHGSDDDRHTFDLESQLAQGQPFLADEYGHVVTPENDPDLEEFLATPDFVAPDFESEETLVRARAHRPPDAADNFSPPPAAAGVPSRPDAAAIPVASAAPAPVGSQAVERRALRVWLGVALSILIVLGLGGGLFAAWYLTRSLSRTGLPTAGGEIAQINLPAAAPRQDAQAKLSEADQLIAAGDTDAAIGRLREAVALDAANAETHRRLARLLLARGARGEAVAEFQAVVNLEPNDVESWRQLAAAQFAEGSYREAADSYGRLLAITNESPADENTLLAYADALRLAGRQAEARSVYQRLASSASAAEIARASRQHLAQLDLAGATTTGDNKRAEKAERQEERGRERVRRDARARAGDARTAGARRHAPTSARIGRDAAAAHARRALRARPEFVVAEPRGGARGIPRGGLRRPPRRLLLPRPRHGRRPRPEKIEPRRTGRRPQLLPTRARRSLLRQSPPLRRPARQRVRQTEETVLSTEY